MEEFYSENIKRYDPVTAKDASQYLSDSSLAQPTTLRSNVPTTNTDPKLVNKNVPSNIKSSDVVQETFTKLSANDIIGLPPMIDIEQETLEDLLVLASMPILAIYPALPAFGNPTDQKMGLELYHLDYNKGLKQYNELLESAGVEKLKGKCLYVAFTHDGNFSESFSNEYGDSVFENISNVASSTISELSAITGKTNVSDIASDLKAQMEKGGIMGNVMGTVASGAGWLGQLGQDFMNKAAPGLGNIWTGSKVDFPQIWKGAGYSTSYSINVKLYNFDPFNIDTQRSRVIHPLAKLLALIIPVTDVAGTTYKFPVAMSVSCPGLFKIKSGYVSSIEIIKGGSENDISYIQRPGIIEVRLTFNTVYSTMVGGSEVKDDFRPTFKDYINQLESYAAVHDFRNTYMSDTDFGKYFGNIADMLSNEAPHSNYNDVDVNDTNYRVATDVKDIHTKLVSTSTDIPNNTSKWGNILI